LSLGYFKSQPKPSYTLPFGTVHTRLLKCTAYTLTWLYAVVLLKQVHFSFGFSSHVLSTAVFPWLSPSFTILYILFLWIIQPRSATIKGKKHGRYGNGALDKQKRWSTWKREDRMTDLLSPPTVLHHHVLYYPPSLSLSPASGDPF